MIKLGSTKYTVLMNTIYNFSTRIVLVGGTLILASTSLGGCSQSAQTAEPDMKTLKAVASTTQICDYVTQIAEGSHDILLHKTASDGKVKDLGATPDKAKTRLELTCLLAPNASAHEHEMSTQQATAMSQADLLFMSGVDLEHFLDAAVASSGFKGTMVVTSGVLTANDVKDLAGQEEKEKSLPYKIDRGSHKVDVAPWPFKPEPGEQPEFQYDPHVWTSPKFALVQTENIVDALAKADPDNAASYQAAGKVYEGKLNDLDKWFKESVDSVPQARRVLFTSHDAFGYMSKTYGIKFEGAALSDFNAQQDATAAKIQETVKQIKDSGATVIFAENSNNPKSVEKVAEAAGIKAIINDEALYGDSLGPDGTDGQTYIGATMHNAITLTTAWEGKVAPIPDSLKEFAPKAEGGNK